MLLQLRRPLREVPRAAQAGGRLRYCLCDRCRCTVRKVGDGFCRPSLGHILR